MKKMSWTALNMIFATGTLAVALGTVTLSRADQVFPDRNTVIVDGQAWDLRTLGFWQPALGDIRPTGEVAQNIQTLGGYLEKLFNLVIYDDYYHSYSTFFNDMILNPPPGQYVFVSTLPQNCIFTPPENLPPGVTTINVGCTEGNVTYLVPQYVQKMDNLQKSLLILHERLHALAPAQPFELKADIVQAAYILLTKYRAAIAQPSDDFRFTPDELTTLNELHIRISQILPIPDTERTHGPQVIFTESGGAISGRFNQIQITATNLFLGVGSTIVSLDGGPIQIQGNNIYVSGGSRISENYQRSLVINSNDLWLSGSTINEPKILLNQTRLMDSQIDDQAGLLSGSQVNMDHSSLTMVRDDYGSAAGCTINGLKMVNSTLVGSVSGSAITITDCVLSGPQSSNGEYGGGSSISGNTVTIRGTNSVESSIAGDRLLVTGSTFDRAVFNGNDSTIARMSIAESQYYGDQMQLQDSRTQLSRIEGVNGFTQNVTTLQGAYIRSPFGDVNYVPSPTNTIKLDHAMLGVSDPDGFDSKIEFDFFPNTSIQNGSLVDEDAALANKPITMGLKDAAVALDGRGKTYKIHRLTFTSQSDLDANGGT